MPIYQQKTKVLLFGQSAALAVFAQWLLNDNAASTPVLGNQLDGALVGGNTSDVAATVSGSPAFHLNGSTEYVQVDAWSLRPSATHLSPSSLNSLWTKYASNPVISDVGLSFGQLCAKPGGGWYYFVAATTSGVYRYQSTDLITWTNKTLVLAVGSAGSFDAKIEVATVFQRVSDGTWYMFYRGDLSGVLKIGMATSPDGTTWTKKNNGGTNDGLVAYFGTNYDPVGVILVGTRYYVFVNGAGAHGIQSVYYSDDDLASWTAFAGNPIFTDTGNHAGFFCPFVWTHGGLYYMLLPTDFGSGTTLYLHAMALYRSTTPTFEAAARTFLGYALVNDQSYDSQYLDTPSLPFTDVYRNTYAAEFGDTAYMLYAGTLSPNVNLASTSLSALYNLPAVKEIQQVIWPSVAHSYSLHVQFDSLADGESIFSIGSSNNDGSPVVLCLVKTSGGNKVVAMFLGGGYRLTTLALAINTPYHIIVTDDLTTTTVYINGTAYGAFVQRNTAVDADYLYLGMSFPGTAPLPGYLWDFRTYSKALTAQEAAALTSGVPVKP